MTMCENCEGLAGKSSDAEPHASLNKQSQSKLRGGMARGYVEFYECTDCGAHLGRDLDDKDPGAIWYKSK